MKSLKNICPDHKRLLELDPNELGLHVLKCIHGADGKPVKRATISTALAEEYDESQKQDVAHAIEEAVGWLFAQCMLGASPYDQDLVFITRKGKKATEHPCDLD